MKTSFRDPFQAFKKAFDKEKISKGDTFRIVYTPEKGTQVYKNSKLAGQIYGLGFKQALWSQWLGGSPVCENLKDGMLGSGEVDGWWEKLKSKLKPKGKSAI